MSITIISGGWGGGRGGRIRAWDTPSVRVHVPVSACEFRFNFPTRLEIVVEPWIDGLWDSLKSVLSISSAFENKKLLPHSEAADSSQLKMQSQHIITGPEQGQLTVNDSDRRTSVEERVVNDVAESIQDRLSILSTSTNKIQTIEAPDSSITRASAALDSLLQSDKVKTVTSDSSLQVNNNMVTVSSSRDSCNSKEDTAIQSTNPQNEETHVIQGSSQAVGESTQSGEMILTSSIEVTSSDGDGGSKRRGSFKEDAASWREELRTPSMELASTPLTLPTVPPLFVKVLIKTVS